MLSGPMTYIWYLIAKIIELQENFYSHFLVQVNDIFFYSHAKKCFLINIISLIGKAYPNDRHTQR